MRKIVSGTLLKDERGSYLKPSPPEAPPIDPPVSDISLDDLWGKHLTLLYRETRELLKESSGGDMLSKDSSQRMRDNFKLIMELKKKEQEWLEALTDEELEKAAKLAK